MRLMTKLTAAAALFVLATATATPQPAAATTIPAISELNTLSAAPATTSLVLAVTMQDAKVDIKVTDESSGAWYTQPVWIAIGIVALVLIILLIVSAGRRDTTTVVK